MVENLYKIFGNHPERALKMLDHGKSKEEVMEKTKQAVGIADVNFKLYEGETLVIMGLSGSGKSTLVRCINRLIEPTKGKVTVDDTDVLALDGDELLEFRRKKFGMVFQHFALFPHRTVLQNAAFGLEIQGVDKDEREQKAMEALELVGLKGWEHQKPEQLSGGMQQRVGLARALAINADILLMDEAFSALDPLIRKDMQAELLSLQEEMQKTILFITHDLDEAIIVGDRIVLMKGGMIDQTGTAEEILTNPATEYVERFVEEIDRSKVLTARTVMVRARAVGYPNDGPRTLLHKMHEEGISSIYMVKRDMTLRGLIKAEDASQCAEDKAKCLDDVMVSDAPKVYMEDSLEKIIPLLTESSMPVAVVDDDDRLKGVVVKGSLLAGMVEKGLDREEEDEQEQAAQDSKREAEKEEEIGKKGEEEKAENQGDK